MATTTSSVINLTKTIIGAGLLAMPFAFRSDGLFFGFMMILFGALTSAFGLLIIYRVSYKLNTVVSFFNLCALSYPRLSLLFDFSIALQCFGTSISYLVIFGDLVPGLFDEAISRNQAILISLVVIVPLISFRRLDSLKFGSVIGLAAIILLTLLVIGHSMLDPPDIERPPLLVWTTGPFSKVISSFSIILFAFTAAQNICSIINEIDNRSAIPVVILIACFISGALFSLVGVAGYLQFSSDVLGNVIMNYDSTLWSTKIGKASLTLMVALSYPLMIHPCRLSVNNMVHFLQETSFHAYTDEATPLLPVDAVHEPKEVPLSDQRFMTISIGLIISTYGLALTVTSFELVLALVGATGSTLICFILPGLFGFKLLDNAIEKKASLALTIFGIVVMVASVFATLYY